MSKVIFRVEKIKTAGNLMGAISHHYRTRETLNADPSIKNVVIKKPSYDVAENMAIIQELNGGTLRQGGVIASDIMISASPDYFRPDDVSAHGAYDEEKLKAWRDKIEPWIEQEFPHALSVVLHLDEATPHYQVLDLPYNPETNKLSHRAKFGGDSRLELGKWQDKAHEAVKSLGIERGMKGSEATHEKMKDFYGHVTKSSTEKPRPSEKVIVPSVFSRTDEGLKQFAEEQRKIERERLRPTFSALEAKAKIHDISNAKSKQTEATLKKYEIENKALKEKSNKMRELPLDDILKKVYGAVLAQDSKIAHESKKYIINDDIEIVMKDNLWIQQDNKIGGKGAINLVMHLEKCDYREAVKILSSSFDPSEIIADRTAALQREAEVEINAISKEQSEPPKPNESKWEQVKNYLVEKRSIPVKLVMELKVKGLLYSDSVGNAVFKRKKNGAFLRGTGIKHFFKTIGKKSEGPFEVPGQGDIYLCESPIDAISIKAMHPEAHAIALGGNMLKISDLDIPKDRKIIMSFDSDLQGRAFDEEAKAIYKDAEIVKAKDAKDMNELLKRRPSLIDDQYTPDLPESSLTPRKKIDLKPR